MPQIPTARHPIGKFCFEYVESETANTDENGKAVHEECYVAAISATASPTYDHEIVQCRRIVAPFIADLERISHVLKALARLHTRGTRAERQ